MDLVLFNITLYSFTTMPKVDLSLWPKERSAYSDKRAPFVLPRYPFRGFSPAMQRIFTAFSSRVTGRTTHFYEMKDFFNFAENRAIRPEFKEIFMAITGEKLKLVSGAVVLPLGLQARECAGLEEELSREALFIEEDPPPVFSYLKIPLAKIATIESVKGSIEVLGFDPNSILLKVNPERPCFLYYSDTFDRSWRAFIDGKASKLYRANMAFKSIILDKGEHIVRFVYDPELYKITLFCYFAGIFMALIMLIYQMLSRKDMK